MPSSLCRIPMQPTKNILHKFTVNGGVCQGFGMFLTHQPLRRWSQEAAGSYSEGGDQRARRDQVWIELTQVTFNVNSQTLRAFTCTLINPSSSSGVP